MKAPAVHIKVGESDRIAPAILHHRFGYLTLYKARISAGEVLAEYRRPEL